jgi:hypothetical protein
MKASKIIHVKNKSVSSRHTLNIQVLRVILTALRQIMEKRFHVIDLHKRYAAIIVRNSEGSEIRRTSRYADFSGYVAKLTNEDEDVLAKILSTCSTEWTRYISK